MKNKSQEQVKPSRTEKGYKLEAPRLKQTKTRKIVKAIAVLLLSFAAMACKDEGQVVNPYQGNGCLTGINANNDRVLIRCATYSNYLAGNNVANGGTANWKDYTGHKWEKCAQCP